jgi:hypothetical protein
MFPGTPHDEGSMREFKIYTDPRLLEAMGLDGDSFRRGLEGQARASQRSTDVSSGGTFS